MVSYTVDTRPTPPPTLAVSPGDYIHRECGGALLKKIGSSAPQALMDKILSFQKSKFMAGYYAEVKEESDTITKVGYVLHIKSLMY